MQGETCSRAPIAPSHDGRGRAGVFGGGLDARTDVLRLEAFGALYYHRQTCAFSAVPPETARFLLAATKKSALEVYWQNPRRLGLDEQTFAEQVVRWQQQGVLDENFICQARIVDEKRTQGALTGPMVTHVQLTRQCNLTCTHCYVDVMATRAPDELSVEQLDALFSDLNRLGSPVVVLAGGEPLLRPDTQEILESVRRHHIDAWVCTNATLIKPDNARAIAHSGVRGFSVSLDGPDAKTHDALRGKGQFERALRGVRLLVEHGAPDVQLRVTVTPLNADVLQDFAPVANALGVDQVVFKPFRQSGEASAQDTLTIDRKTYDDAIARASKAWPDDGVRADFGDGMPQRPPAWTRIQPDFACVGGTTSVTVTYDGRVTGCGSVLSENDWTLHTHRFGDAWRKAPGVTLWRTFEGNDDCQSCHNFAVCGGGCRARAVGAGLDVNDHDPWAPCSLDDERVKARQRTRATRTLPVLADV